MLPPGLLPESSEPRRSKAPWILAVVVFCSLLMLLGALLQIRHLTHERDAALEKLTAQQKKIVETPPVPVEAPTERSEPRPAAPPAPVPAPPPPASTRAPELRVRPERNPDAQHISQGLHEFRAGRYDQAERQFFRAFPDSLLYLALSSLAQANYREAIGFLHRAMTTDPNWLRKVKPGDLFGSELAYEGVLQALEEQLAKNPINPDLKTLLAFLRFHDKGAAYAKALLIEATNASPDHEPAKAFLEVLGP